MGQGGLSKKAKKVQEDSTCKGIQGSTSKEEIKCVCLNARSIINKKDELNIMVDDIKPHIIVSETDRSGHEQSMFTDSRLLLSSPERQPYKHTQIQVYNRYYNSDYTPYYQYCILHIPTWGSISHVNGSHIYLCHITCRTSIDRNSYYK